MMNRASGYFAADPHGDQFVDVWAADKTPWSLRDELVYLKEYIRARSRELYYADDDGDGCTGTQAIESVIVEP